VAAASVNPVDWKIARGDMAPMVPIPQIPGLDCSGWVVATGDRVTRFKVGDQVWGDIAPRSGSYAEFCIADEANLDLKPNNLDIHSAAAVPLAAMTAYQGLVLTAQLKAGDKVLILGGSSGVGHFAVQIAKAHGATVWATCSTRNVEFVKSLGADFVIDYTKQEFSSMMRDEEMDIVFDVVGKTKDRNDAFAKVRKQGHLVTTQPVEEEEKPSFLKMIGATLKFAWDKTTSALWRGVQYHAFLTDASQGHRDLPILRQMVEAGTLRPMIDTMMPLEQVDQAWARSKVGAVAGKIVLKVAASSSPA